MDRYSREEECDLCDGLFPDSRRLYCHLFNDHDLSKEKIEIVKQARRFKQVAKKVHIGGRNRQVFECDICQRPYLSKLGLRNHKEKEHNEIPQDSASADNVVCPIDSCSARFQTYFDLATHADEYHQDLVNESGVFRIHRTVFNNFNDFRLWKQMKEEATSSRFYTRSTETKIRYAKKVWLMKCIHTHRKRLRLYSFDHCSAFMRVCERHNGLVEVVACFGHLGHMHASRIDSKLDKKKINYTLEPDYHDSSTFEPNQEAGYISPESNSKYSF